MAEIKQIETSELKEFQNIRQKVLTFASNLTGALLKSISNKYGVDPTGETEQVEKKLNLALIVLAVALTGIAKLCKIDLNELSVELTETQVDKIKGLIANLANEKDEPKSFKTVQDYYKKFGIELGKLDFLDGITFKNQFGNTGGSVRLEGKKSNNIMGFNGKILESSVFPKTMETKEDANKALIAMQSNILLIHTIIHELHHRLFNLDSRLNLDGSNDNLSLLPNNIREGCVEYLAQKVSLSIIEDSPLTSSLDMSNEEIQGLITPSKKYQKYTKTIETYLDDLASKLGVKNSSKPEVTRIEVEKMFINFFLSGDRQILDLAKGLNVKNIFQI